MRMRRKPWARKELDVCDYFIKDPLEHRGEWKDMFHKEQPIHLEVGCGKGTFTAVLARKNQDINYIAIDIKSDILAVARRNIHKEYEQHNIEVENILLFSADIERINQVIGGGDMIDRIYINFCNPWNKQLQKKKRLTHTKQLLHYREFLVDGGEIHFKTDDDILFQDSIEYFKESGLLITFINYDLHNSDVTDNITTEHEDMFSAKGIKIKKLICKKLEINDTKENKE